MKVTVTPATIFDMAEHAHAMTRTQWAVAREIFDRGQFYLFHAGDELVAFAGFTAINDADAEMLFNPLPSARRHIWGLLAAGRLTIEASPYRAIVTVCGSEAGKVLARRLGFTFQATIDLGEVWANGRSDGQDGAGRAGAAEEQHRRGAAPDAGADGGGAG